MPLTRRIIRIGSSRAVIIPKSWLDYYEEVTGTLIEQVLIDVNSVLRISPMINNEEKGAYTIGVSLEEEEK